jgi:hypothetical protein
MPTLPLSPEPPDKVFGLSSPNLLYVKLTWELENIKKALSSEDWEQQSEASYHAFNFAVTAYHMIDWVWETSDAESHALMSKSLNNERINQKGDFVAAVSNKYRSIYICRLIANSSKHYQLTRRDDPAIHVREHWNYGETDDGEPLTVVSLEICDGDNVWSAVEVFSEAVRDWSRLLRALGYFEDTFVEGNSPA